MSPTTKPLFWILLVLFLTSGSLANREETPRWGSGRTCPTEIHTTVPGDYYPESEPPEFGTMAQVHAALSSCPNITDLNLRVTLMGCSEWPDRWSFPFDLAGGDKYPTALKTLSLEGYNFGDTEWDSVTRPPARSVESLMYWMSSGRARTWLKWSRLPESQRLKTNLELWLDAMDFSHIHTLSLADVHDQPGSRDLLTELLAPRLTGLRSLRLEGSWAHDFFHALAPNTLSKLAWLEGGESIDSILELQGSSLTSLELRSPETMSGIGPMLSVEEIQDLGSRAPKLADLVIDIRRNGTWPLENLQALSSSLPNLTNLTIYMEIASECRRQLSEAWDVGDGCSTECAGFEQYAHPLLTVTSASEVFALLRDNKVGEELAHLKLFSGDWSRPWDGPLYFPPWIEGRTAWAECEIRFENGTRRPDNNLCWGEDSFIPASELLPRCRDEL